MPASPSSLGSYRVHHQLGVGTLGPVFLASDEVLHVTAAVKLINVDASPDQVTALVQRVNAVAARQPKHPGLIQIIEAGVAGHVAYVAMEHAEGPSLGARLGERDSALPAEALGWLEALADAIDAMHAAELDHGSLHPRDLFLTSAGARISGCGLARAIEAVGLRAPLRPPYTAPERVAGPTWGRAADIFSLAAIAFECLAGRRPAGTGRAAAERLPPTISPEYDRPLREVFARGLSADVNRRPASARELVQALLDAGASYVYGREATRVAVHHRGVVAPGAAGMGAATEGTGDAGANDADDVDLARFASEGVLPSAAGPARTRRRSSASSRRKAAPEPHDEGDPLTLFQPEPDASDAADRREAPETPESPETPETIEPFERPETLEPLESIELAGAPDTPSTDARAESESWLASASAVPLVDLQDETEPAAAVGAGPGTSADRFSSIEPSADRAASPGDGPESPPEGPRELGETEWEGAPAMAVDPGAPERELSLRPETAAGSGAVSAATLFADDEEAWDEPIDERPRRRVLIPVLLLLLAVVAAWYYVPWASLLPEIPPAEPIVDNRVTGEVADTERRQGEPAASDSETDAATSPPRATPPAASADRPSTPAAGDVRSADRGSVTEGGDARTAPSEIEPRPAPPTRARSDTPSAARSAAAAQSAAVAERAETPSTREQGGRLLVRTSPSASVTVDGEPRGTSPVALYALDWGPYTVVAQRRGYAEEMRRVMITPDQPAAAVTIDLRPADAGPEEASAAGMAASVAGQTAPGEGAQERTTAPSARAPGARAPGAPAPGAPAPGAPARDAPPQPNRSARARDDTRAEASAAGTIMAVTRPSGAQVTVDGRSAGTTPATIPDVPTGRRVVRFELAGYGTWETTVTVEAGGRLRVAASLEQDR